MFVNMCDTYKMLKKTHSESSKNRSVEDQAIYSMYVISCTPEFLSTALRLGVVKNRASSPSVVGPRVSGLWVMQG